ncbi:myb-related protein 2-like isoform X2 [Ananas comosus]|uniref:Myb-related protein 2-like isoform X2 n=1 Tax=Ananas comosus TaxID=4615 RepID=A0A6P5F6L8_ANACO|nr:myb-related protein 2-like isoform X2 [Ananas comosus]
MYGLSVFQGQQHKGSTSHNSYICWRGDDSQLPLRRKCPTITAIRGWFYQPTPSRALNGLNSFTTDSSMRSLGLAEQTVMGVPGLTLYHLKSHLQKYRLAKSRDTNILHDYSEGEIQCKILERSTPDADENKAQNQLDETMLQMQMQVQRKLQEQIERHLQLRIEAQGKYLQNVLRKAQETLSAYSSNSIGTDVVKAELSELASAVGNECLNSPPPQPCLVFNISQQSDCSIDSSLTSSEKPDKATEKSRRIGSSSSSCNGSEELQSRGINYDSGEAVGTKRSRSSICGEATLDEHTTWKRIFHQKECSFEEPEELDLNR